MTALILWLAATVLLLAAVAWSGAAARRRLHYALVLAMLAALTLAIRAAEAVGRSLTYTGTAATLKDWHFVSVGLTFALLFALIASGVRLHRLECPRRRKQHKLLAAAFVVAVLTTSALGTGMTALADPREAAAGQ